MQRLMSTFPDVPRTMLAVIAPLLYKKRNSNRFTTWNMEKKVYMNRFPHLLAIFYEQAGLLETFVDTNLRSNNCL